MHRPLAKVITNGAFDLLLCVVLCAHVASRGLFLSGRQRGSIIPGEPIILYRDRTHIKYARTYVFARVISIEVVQGAPDAKPKPKFKFLGPRQGVPETWTGSR